MCCLYRAPLFARVQFVPGEESRHSDTAVQDHRGKPVVAADTLLRGSAHCRRPCRIPGFSDFFDYSESAYFSNFPVGSSAWGDVAFPRSRFPEIRKLDGCPQAPRNPEARRLLSEARGSTFEQKIQISGYPNIRIFLDIRISRIQLSGYNPDSSHKLEGNN